MPGPSVPAIMAQMRASLALAVVAALLLSDGGSAIAVEVARTAEAPAAEVPALAPALPGLSGPPGSGGAVDQTLTASGLPDAAVGPRTAAAEPQAEASGLAAEASAAASAPGAAIASARGAREAGEGKAGWSSALRRFFDRSRPAAAEDDSTPVPSTLGRFAPEDVPVLLVAPGRAPERSTLAAAAELIEERGLSADFASRGHFRLVVGDQAKQGDLTEDQLSPLLRLLRSYGLAPDDARVRVERMVVKTGEAGPSVQPASPQAAPFSPARAAVRLAVGAAAGAAAFWAFGATYPLAAVMVAGFASIADRFVVEAAYSIRLFIAALRQSRRPTWKEVGGGFVGKIAPGILNAVAFWAMYNASGPHHAAAAVAIGLSLAVETFHGVWADSWNNLQAKLSAYRGSVYQGVFNFVYGGLIGASYRLVAFIALSMAPPWTGEYWAPMIVMMLIGTFVSTLGFRGMNGLYEKGVITRWGRSKRQYLRDIFMMVTGPLFGTGYVMLTWVAFAIQQSLDLYFFYRNNRTPTEPILYVSDPGVARTDEFDHSFVRPIDPMKQATDALLGNPIAKGALAAYRWVKGRLSGPSK